MPSAPGADVPELQDARRLWQHNHFDAALRAFRKAVDLHPRNPVALLDAARAFGARYQIALAEQWLERLLELKGQDPVTLHLVAQSFRMIHRPRRAAALFERVLALTDAVPDAYLELALLHERSHRLPEAADLVEACLKAAPGYREPLLVRARVDRRLGREGRAEATLRDLAADSHAEPLLKAQAWAELADLHDRRGEYDEAIRSIRRCKDIQLGQADVVKRVSDHLVTTFGGLAEQVSREDFTRWREQLPPEEVRRVALLGGFPRSGTTLIEQVLDAHPGLASSEELEAFSRDVFPGMWRTGPASAPSIAALSDVTPAKHRDLRLQYLAAMDQVRGESLAGRVHLDKNPTLTLLIPAFRRLFPEAVVLLALRDPRDVVLSCFLRYLPLNTNSVWYLTLPRAAERYALDMRAWLTVRDKLGGGWIQVRYEDVVRDLEVQARRCLEALGLPWDESVLNYRDRLCGADGAPERVVHSPSYEAVSKPLYKSAVGRWEHYKPYLEPVLPVLEPFIREFGYA